MTFSMGKQIVVKAALFFFMGAGGALLCDQEPDAAAAARSPMPAFLDRVGIGPNAKGAVMTAPVALCAAQQDFKKLTADACCHTLTPITLGGPASRKGLGMHANGHAAFRLNAPFARFRAEVGVDNNSDTQGSRGSVEFIVKVDGKEVVKTPVCRGGDRPGALMFPWKARKTSSFFITDAGDGYGYDQADWADARLIDRTGKRPTSAMLPASESISVSSAKERLPASFVYGGRGHRICLRSGRGRTS